MLISDTWSITGAESLPIHGNTHSPQGTPRAVALVIHGWTGHKDRNITPAAAHHLARMGLIAHRVTLSHAGVEKDADDITRLDEFEQDSNDACIHDIHALVSAINDETIRGNGLPLLLVGHSRGGATVYRAAAEAETTPWELKPAALISLAATATLTRLTDDVKRQLDEKRYVERECKRSPTGTVRMGRSWYQHHLDSADDGGGGGDLLAKSIAAVRCPVLIAHGSDDTSVPPDQAETIESYFRAHNPHVTPRRVNVPGADHNFNVAGFHPSLTSMTNPAAAQLFRAVERFLDDVAPWQAR